MGKNTRVEQTAGLGNGLKSVSPEIGRLMELMVRWHYMPAKRFENPAAAAPAMEKQLAYITKLAQWNGDAIADISELLKLAWGASADQWTVADATFIIGALRVRENPGSSKGKVYQ